MGHHPVPSELNSDLRNGVDRSVGSALPLVDEEGEQRHERRVHDADPQAEAEVGQGEVPHVEGIRVS